MTNVVYDTILIAQANGAIAGRRAGNVMDLRLAAIEKFLKGMRVAWYNSKLEKEYGEKIKQTRNDVIEAFIIRLADHGKRSKRSSLSRQEHARARDLGWPSHDQHLLAAAIDAGDAMISTSEVALRACSKALRREFSVSIEHI
jgi:hypothetical protein